MDVSLDKDVDATNAIKFNFDVFVVTPIAHLGHILASSVKLLVAYMHAVRIVSARALVLLTLDDDGIFGQAIGEFATLVRFDPRVVVDCSRM